ncbi:MauE/DoxX family redox-associated membrane protein [Cryptosporangium minutisporangium]|uniref:MauE/DoxX family redox-associated membrane protein n=1 Tax=Cryptosporangium minutisporangium TaxID=113569 RepID=UPI0035EF904D
MPWAAALPVLAGAVVATTFAVSAVAKVRDLDGFHHTITLFTPLPDRVARWTAPAVVALEALLVALLAAGVVLGAGGAIAAGLAGGVVLLAGYTAILARARLQGTSVGCNCFGRTAQRLSWYDVVRNLLLLGVGGAGWAASAEPAPPLAGADTGLLVITGAALTVLVIHLGDVAEVLRRPLALDLEDAS